VLPSLGDGQNIDPRSLAISNELCSDLMSWASAYDATLVWIDPLASGFSTEAAEHEFKHEGSRLKERLQAELGAEAVVTLLFV